VNGLKVAQVNDEHAIFGLLRQGQNRIERRSDLEYGALDLDDGGATTGAEQCSFFSFHHVDIVVLRVSRDSIAKTKRLRQEVLIRD